jgi:hypothetical protein
MHIAHEHVQQPYIAKHWGLDRVRLPTLDGDAGEHVYPGQQTTAKDVVSSSAAPTARLSGEMVPSGESPSCQIENVSSK